MRMNSGAVLTKISAAILIVLNIQHSTGGATVIVPGTSNPWLAGLPDGASAQQGDVAPANSPVLAPIPIFPGTFLTFTAEGLVNNNPVPGGSEPDGGSLQIHVAENGIAGFTAPINALLGVFLNDSLPTSSAVPDPYVFTPDALTIAPDLKQVFFIGDGMRLGGDIQQFLVPSGATRLFIGTMDGAQWNNNYGEFSVTVVPEPSTWALGIIGGLWFATGLSKRRR
jgi:hypothetical protein